MENKRLFYTVAINLVIIYITGLVGIGFTSATSKQLFLLFIPVNLLITAISTLIFHKKRDLKFLLLAFFIFFAGFFTELIGVKTGWVFGQYYYGHSLGFRLFQVPLIIGLNWFLLVYCIGTTFYRIKNNISYSVLCAAVMTLLDVFIEPVAIRLDFWHWENEIIPLQNYIAWFIISFCLFYLFRNRNGWDGNPFSKIVLVIFFLFFGILNVILR